VTRARDWALLAVPGVIWGASFVLIAEGLRAIGPDGVTFVRILIGFLTLALFRSAWSRVALRDWPAIALLGAVWFAFPLSMFPHAEEHVSSAVTGMLNGAVPFLTAIVSSALARRLPSKQIMAGLLTGMAGVALIAIPAMKEGRNETASVLLILAACVSYGFALSIARPLQQKYNAIAVIWRAQLVALALTMPRGIAQVAHAHWSPVPLASLVALGALGTAVAFVVMTIAAGRVGPTRASASTFLIPVVALLLGVVVRGDHVPVLAVAGCAVCIGGAILIRLPHAAADRGTALFPPGGSNGMLASRVS